MSQLVVMTYTNFLAVTPSDTARVSCRAILVGGAGNVALSVDGTTTAVTLTGLTAGQIVPVMLDQGRVMSTNTTATALTLLS